MPKKYKSSEIEKILNEFENSDISDLEDSDHDDILDDLMGALEKNNSFLIEELSRQNPTEINMEHIEENEMQEEEVEQEEGQGGQEKLLESFMKLDDYRWKKDEWVAPEAPFENMIGKHNIKTPLQYFLEYFTDDLLTEIVSATNQTSLIKKGMSINITNEELLQFIALEIMIGTIDFPRLVMYWSKSTEIPSFRQSMTRPRFHLIRNSLKFTSSTNKIDKLIKVRPLLDTFCNKLHSLEKDENICVDEMMVPFKGRTGLRQYMPKKPIKWGMNIFCLCSSKGILYDFEIYQGKNTIIGEKKFGFCSDIVIHLCKTISDNKNYKLFFDNYFTTLALVRYLKQRGIWATGTIRTNRIGKIPLQTEKDLKKIGRGSFDFRIERNENIVIVRWLDGGIVQLVSTIYGPEKVNFVSRFCSIEKNNIEIMQPQLITHYNKNMGGVDKLDFLLSLYRISIRSKKWTLKIFDHFIDLAVCNSWLEYKIDCESNKVQKKDCMDLLSFRNDISDSLLTVSAQKIGIRKRGRPKALANENSPSNLEISSPTRSKKKCEVTPLVSVRYDGLSHWPDYTAGKVRCKAVGCSAYSRYKCVKCNVHLCIPNASRNCYKLYHTREI